MRLLSDGGAAQLRSRTGIAWSFFGLVEFIAGWDLS